MGTRYRMAQNLAAANVDIVIKNDQGKGIFKIDAHALAVLDTVQFRDLEGNLLCEIQGSEVRVKDMVDITAPGSETLGVVKRSSLSPLRDEFSIRTGDGAIWFAQGTISDHDYCILSPSATIAEVSRRWFKARNSYGVDVAPGQNDVFVLAAVACIDLMTRASP